MSIFKGLGEEDRRDYCLDGRTPLHYAIDPTFGADTDCLFSRIGEGVDRFADHSKQVALIEELIHRGADVNALTVAGDTPLMTAEDTPYEIETVEALLRGGASIEAGNPDRKTTRYLQLFQKLLKRPLWLTPWHLYSGLQPLCMHAPL